jgi:hypothetical protein
VQWFLQELQARELDWLVATRADRRLRSGVEIRAFRAWRPALPLARLASEPRGKTLWGACLPEATLLERHCNQRGLACRPRDVERRDAAGRVEHCWYLLARRRDLEPATLWQRWQQRWPVEGLHRASKQALHLEAYHGRTWAASVAWVVATSLRASLLAVLQAVEADLSGTRFPGAGRCPEPPALPAAAHGRPPRPDPAAPGAGGHGALAHHRPAAAGGQVLAHPPGGRLTYSALPPHHQNCLTPAAGRGMG